MSLAINEKVHALILAGKRPKDLLSAQFGLPNKAFIEFQGKSLVSYSIDALSESRLVDELFISINPEQESLFNEVLSESKRTFQKILVPMGSSPVCAIEKTLACVDKGDGLLVITADNPTLSPEIIEYFLTKVIRSDSEKNKSSNCFSIACVNGCEELLLKFPEMKSQRTWYKLNKKTWLSGANMFYFKLDKTGRANFFNKLESLEINRKRPLQLAQVLSQIKKIDFLLRFVLQRTSIEECEKIASQVLGTESRIIELPYAFSCIDVDKPSDYEFLNKFFKQPKSC